mgnify:CR=1 FL=1
MGQNKLGGKNVNYSRELQKLIDGLGDRTPGLLLHACCAPCSSAVLEYLSRYFKISILFYNPNIAPAGEYEKRLYELSRLIQSMPMVYQPKLIAGRYEPQKFLEAAAGLEEATEGGERCMACYRLRLREAAAAAKQLGLEYFTTTLSISPLKNARALNQIGEELGEEYGVRHLPSDFKKREGYKRSIELSREYGLYRQDYCGCVFSKAQRERQKKMGETGYERTELRCL